MKKGSFFVPLSILGAIIVLISLISILYIKQGNAETLAGAKIGEHAISVFDTYQQAEKQLLYIDLAASISARSAVASSAADLTASLPCANPKLWSEEALDKSCANVRQSCFPSSDDASRAFEERFMEAFDKKLNDYKAAEPGFKPVSYDVKLEGLSVVGTPKEKMTIVKYDKSLKLQEYKFSPSFKVEIPLDFAADAFLIAQKAAEIAAMPFDEKLISDKAAEFSSDVFKWAVASSASEKPSCSKVLGACSYKAGKSCRKEKIDCDEKGNCAEEIEVCLDDYRSAELKRTIGYREHLAKFSVERLKPINVDGKFKNIEYKFGISWIEQTSCADHCGPEKLGECPVENTGRFE